MDIEEILEFSGEFVINSQIWDCWYHSCRFAIKYIRLDLNNLVLHYDYKSAKNQRVAKKAC